MLDLVTNIRLIIINDNIINCFFVMNHGGIIVHYNHMPCWLEWLFFTKWFDPIWCHTQMYMIRLHAKFRPPCLHKVLFVGVYYMLYKPSWLWLWWCHNINFAWDGVIYIHCNQRSSENAKAFALSLFISQPFCTWAFDNINIIQL